MNVTGGPSEGKKDAQGGVQGREEEGGWREKRGIIDDFHAIVWKHAQVQIAQSCPQKTREEQRAKASLCLVHWK